MSPASTIKPFAAPWPWRDLGEARAQFTWPLAEIDTEWWDRPWRVVTVKLPPKFDDPGGPEGYIRRVPILHGPPEAVDNVWLAYPGRRHAVTATARSQVTDDRRPAGVILDWFHMSVDANEDSGGSQSPDIPEADRLPLVIDGVECETWYKRTSLICRVARVGDMWYATLNPPGLTAETRLVTK